MFSNLPLNVKKALIYLLVCLFFALGYFIFVRIPQQGAIEEAKIKKQKEIAEKTKNSQKAYFVPPKSLYKELEVVGRVERLLDSDKIEGIDSKATHKIIDNSGKIIYYAFSKDDKLYQQEGYEVTLGIKASYSTKPYSNFLVESVYIAIK